MTSRANEFHSAFTLIELVVDPYFPKTVPTVPSGMSGRTIHAGGRNRILLDGHAQFLKDARTPSP